MTPCAAGIPRVVLALCAAALAACSSFQARWEAAEKAPAAPGVSRWEGRWESALHTNRRGNPDGGRLRAVFTEMSPASGSELPPGPPAGDRRPLRADFRAYWKSFATNYTLTLTPVPGARTEFRGTHELPAIFGGTYRYTARLAGDRFTARYDSSYDRGTFTLGRVRPHKDLRPSDSRH